MRIKNCVNVWIQGVNGIVYDFMIGLNWIDLLISSLNLRAAKRLIYVIKRDEKNKIFFTFVTAIL